MHDWLSAQADSSPHKTALITAEGTWSFAQLQRLVSERAAILDDLGLTNHTRAALLLNNSADYVILLLAILRCGGVVVPINARLRAEEIAYQLRNARVDMLFVAPEYHHIAGLIFPTILDTQKGEEEQTDTINRVPTETPRSVGATYMPSETPKKNTRVQFYSTCETTHYKTIIPFPAYQNQRPITAREIDLDTPLAIIHTSGTSGKPKGAVLTYGNVFYSAMASAYRLGHLPDDKWLCALPLFHIGGLSIILRACLYGIPVDLRDKFDVDKVNHALTHEGISLVSLVPTMLYRLLEARQMPWSDRLRLVLLGGAAASLELIQRCRDEGIPIATTYGLTEAASQVATALPNLVGEKPGTVGKPLLFTRVRIVDETGRDQPTGVYGEVLVQGPTVMQGYASDPDATEKILRDGWLHTGDIGYLDGDGDLWIIQRRSDLILSGGENVYPAEVEAVLRSHPAVREAAVIGVDDPEWGQQVAAAVQLESGHSLMEAELIAYARERLAGYKLPRRIRFIDALPQTPSGKIERKAVQALFDQPSP